MRNGRGVSVFSVLLLSSVFGAASAFTQAYFVSGNALLSLAVAFVGAVVGPLVALVIRQMIFDSKMFLPEVIIIGFTSWLLGAIIIRAVSPPGWSSGVWTLIAVLIVSLLLRHRNRRRETHNA